MGEVLVGDGDVYVVLDDDWICYVEECEGFVVWSGKGVKVI